jgi:hypothetical protein
MKLTLNKILIFLAIAIVAVIVSFCIHAVNSFEDFCEEGSGLTTVNGKVLDFNTHQPIDSVQLTIRYGMSADRAVDTLLYQADGISYSFVIREDDCEPYWVEVYNKHYWHDAEFDSTMGDVLIKGGVSNFVAYLKPATTIKLTLERELKNTTPDTVFLYLSEPGQGFRRWSYFSLADFLEKDTASYISSYYDFEDSNGKRKITTYDNMESLNVDHQVQWIRKTDTYIDTVFTEFKSKPFDTVHLKYEFVKLPAKQNP